MCYLYNILCYNNMAQKVRKVGSDTIDIPIKINFQVTDHFNKRLASRKLTQDNIIEVVRQALPFLLKKKINKRKATTSFTVCDKQTCIVAIVELNEESNIMQQTALIRTSFIFDGKGEPLQPNTFFINENNPSPEFEEAEQISEWYGHTWSNGGDASGAPKYFVDKNYDAYGNPTSYKGYLKYHDPERKNITKMVNKKKINQVYADIAKQKEEEINKAWAMHNTDDALNRADSEILTPYGPNGSLRGIDRKRKKIAKDNNNESKNMNMTKNVIKLTESQLKNIIKESVGKILKEIGDTPRGQYAMAAVAGRANQRAKMARANGNQDEYWKQMDKFHNAEDARTTAAVNSVNNNQMASSDVARATSRGYNYGLRMGMTESNEDFQPHGYKGTSNWGGLEMQISDRGDAARLRNSITNQISDWLEIQFDEEGVAYVIDENGEEERLCDYMRY